MLKRENSNKGVFPFLLNLSIVGLKGGFNL